MHVDEWLDQPIFAQDGNRGEVVARLFLEMARMPAWKEMLYSGHIKPVVCTYQGKVYRVTGASRLGGIYLQPDLEKTHSYEHNVDPDWCTDWELLDEYLERIKQPSNSHQTKPC